MKKYILAVTALCVVVVTAFGQTTTSSPTATTGTVVSIPASLPIGSPEQLMAFAVGQTSQGYISHSSSTMLSNNNSMSFIHLMNGDIGDLLTSLSNTNASFDVANTQDQVNTYVNVMNADWETMFWGSRNGNITKVNGEWKLPTTPVTMHIADYIPLKFPGANYAQLVVRDQYGNIVDWRSMNASNDEITFKTALAGWGTELIVYYNDNNGNYGSVAYSVPNAGKQIVSSSVTGTTSVSIENMLAFNDANLNPVITSYGMNLSVGYDAKGSTGAPLLHMVLNKSRQMTLNVNAFALDAYKPFLAPTKYVIYQFSFGQLVSVTEMTADPNGFVTGNFAPGTYEITPIFPGNPFTKKTLAPQDNNYGSTDGGKG
ncbi:MAG: hypothetical protein WCO16_00605 [bacterium]